MVYSTRRFDICLTLCDFVLVFFSPFSIAITSFGEERANLNAFRTFVRFAALVWFCLFPLPLGVWEGLWCVIVALPGLFLPFFVCVVVMTSRHRAPNFTALVLSVSSSSWCLGRAVVCDCGTPWTFLLPFFVCVVVMTSRHRAPNFTASAHNCHHFFEQIKSVNP